MRNYPIVSIILLLLFLALAYLLFWPVTIEPAAWNPKSSPQLKGPYGVNDRLVGLERLGQNVIKGKGPEDVALDARGRIYTGTDDGNIIRLDNKGLHPEIFARTGGRPLGLHFDNQGNLIAAVADKGLLSIAPGGEVSVLSKEVEGKRLSFVNDVDISAEGIIYFTDTSSKFSIREYKLDLMEHRPNGRLLAYDPKSGKTIQLLDGIYYANGVAVSHDQRFLLVVEMGKYRVRRYWLAGPKKGTSEIFIENLPGFPDGISSGENGVFWLPLVSPRLDQFDNILLPNPLLRKVLARLPGFLLPRAKDYGFVLGINNDGNIVHNLQDPSGSYAQITSVQEYNGYLYLGSLVENSIGRLRTP